MPVRTLVVWWPDWEVAAGPGPGAREWEPAVAAVAVFSPLVEVMAPGAVALATRGPSRYFGGDLALATQVAAAVDGAVGPHNSACGCVVGVADGRFAAQLAAREALGRHERVLVVPAGESPSWLASRPIQALETAGVDADLVDLLVRLGLRTLGAFAGVPVASVLGRFGAAGAAAHRLASGLDRTPLAASAPPPNLSVVAELDPPAERVETAAFVAKGLADELHDLLADRGLTCSRVLIEAETEHGERLVRRWRHEGALTAGATAERVRWQLDGWLTGGDRLRQAGDLQPRPAGAGGRQLGGLTLLRLTPEEVHPDVGRQLGLWGGSAAADARAARGLARVQGLLGPEAVTTAVVGWGGSGAGVGGRGPADPVRYVAWGDARGPEQPSSVRAASIRAGAERPPWPGRITGPAPATVYQPSLAADVRDITDREVTISGRGVPSGPPATVSLAGGSSERVYGWAGPWPVEERWWDGDGRRLARLQLEVEGGAAHLLVRECGRWWVEATYD
ncbi:MAG: hypothetical protein J2P57_14610 [Acidimicrobiaceae bacterium]|nr:hypothetical protein [Acidimicrobiaceae bacterium]